jgi:hypothetical protein
MEGGLVPLAGMGSAAALALVSGGLESRLSAALELSF